MGLQEWQFVTCEWLKLPQLGSDDSRYAADGTGGRLPSLPVPSYRVAQVEAIDCIDEIAHEIAPAKLAICYSLKSKLILFGKNAQDVLVFDLAQRFWTWGFPCFEQGERAKKTADVICSECCVHF